ncbi:hypothetical protein AURDEDRAFT_163393 [Auricularia subglabra TFB-10046 SS5]|nr:hypothetical protein AURDEDRAFT_163393 [Auricularia subglabra TFB-10046 SS5]
MRVVLQAAQTLPRNLEPLPQAEVDAAQAAAHSSPVDAVLDTIHEQKMTLGGFLTELFSRHPHGESCSRRHASMVSKLLQGTGGVNPRAIVEAMYAHHDSAPPETRGDSRAAQNPKDGSDMARAQLTEWAVQLVVQLLRKEMDVLVDPASSPLRPPKPFTWTALLGFSFAPVLAAVRKHTPILLRILFAAAVRAKDPGSNANLPPPPAGGRARVKHRPVHIVLAILAMLSICRSERANLFQRLISVWLWSTKAGPAVFAIFSRVSYCAQLDELRALVRRGVLFLILYDNINIFRRIWAPRLAQQSQLQNGTAMTAVLIEGAEETAFDLGPVQEKRPLGAK